MLLRKKLILIIFSLIVLIATYRTCVARSVYVVSDTGTQTYDDSFLRVYKVVGNSLVYQQIEYKTLTRHAIGLAIDESEYGQFLFVTFELSDEIELINAKTMQYVDTITAQGADNLAGVAMDSGKSKLYAVDRYTNHLYSWSWDPATKTLTPDFNDPNYYIELEGISEETDEGAFGISLDENGLLYVADNTDSVKYYDTNDWSKEGEVNELSCNVISIAIDVNNQLLYYGSMGKYGEGDPHLYRYNISTETENSENVGCSVAGIAVDQQSSLVYLTTYGGPDDSEELYPKDRLFVYDSNLNEKWNSDDIGNPAGVTVYGNVSYKPPVFYLEKIDINEPNYVVPGDEMTYMIIYGPNSYEHNNIVITDYLPFEVQYLSSDPCGTYNPDNHTVTWQLEPLDADDPNDFVTLTVKVNENAEPNENFTNYCEIESDNGYCHTEYVTKLCCAINLFPACDATVDLYVNGLKLIWSPGHFAAYTDGHDVYFGTDYNSVLNADDDDQTGIYRGRQTETEYTLTNLDLETTYYWRIDEANEANICQGVVRSFTTSDFYVIDDFEYYTVSDPEGTGTCPYYDGNDRRIDLNNDMRYWWLDGHVQKNPQGDCGGDFLDYNPLLVQCTTVGRSPGSRIIRTDFGRTGYGMSYYYNNDNVDNSQFPPEPDVTEDRYSEVLRYYAGGVNLTLDNTIDVNLAALGLFFLGLPDNNCNPTYDRMYVVLEDMDVTTSGDHKYRGDDAQINHPDPNAAQVTDWTTWTIKLKEFTDKNSALDLTRVRSVRIGFGKRLNSYSSTPGGEGTVIFDDIRLYPYCSQADMDSDCDVDFCDYAIFANAWLTSSGQPNYDPNCDLADNDSAIDCNDLALFCEDWLSGAGWNLQESMTLGRGAGPGLEQSAYSVSLFEQAEQLEQQPVEVEPADIERLLEWLEDIWLTEPQIRETISEQDWNGFIESLKDYQ